MMKLIVDFPSSRRLNSYAEERRSVRFSDNSYVKYIANLTTEYRSNIWYTQEESRRFKRDIAILLRELKSNGITLATIAKQRVEQDTSCFMGLESFLTESTHTQILIHKKAHYKAVFDEQQWQLCAGIDDPDALANVAHASSRMSRERSMLIAKIHS